MKPASGVRLVPTEILDPNTGTQALRLLLPAGWKAEARFDWSSNATDPCRVIVHICNPEGPEALTLYPSLMFAAGAREELARVFAQGGMHPSLAYQRAAQTYPEGSSYYGLEVRGMVGDRRQLVEQILLPRYKPEVRERRIVALENLPQLAEEAFERDQANAQAFGAVPTKGIRYSGTRLRFDYALNGKPMAEEIYYVTYLMPLSGVASHWGIRGPVSFRAAQSDLDRVLPVLRAVQTSVKPVPAWLVLARQVSQRLLQAAQQNQMLAVDQAMRAAERRGAFFDSLYQQYQEREAMHDRVQEKFIQTIKGVEAYDDPFQELPVELPTGYERAWVNERGEYFLAEKSFNEPHIGSSDHWRELRKLKPGEKK